MLRRSSGATPASPYRRLATYQTPCVQMTQHRNFYVEQHLPPNLSGAETGSSDVFTKPCELHTPISDDVHEMRKKLNDLSIKVSLLETNTRMSKDIAKLNEKVTSFQRSMTKANDLEQVTPKTRRTKQF